MADRASTTLRIMNDMKTKRYGNTALDVPVLGLGAGQIGDASLPEDEVAQLLNHALDQGVRLIDTARGYGLSEERIGRHLSHRRSEFLLSTKVGYDIPGHQDWTGACVEAGVDAALGRLKTDVIDIVHLHSCDVGILQARDVIDALDRAKAKGKLRVVAYSGENEALSWAVDSARFGGVECSINLFDQAGLDGAVLDAERAGMGVIAKRPLGNAPWRFAERPVGNYAETYWTRMHALAYDAGGLPWDEFALRFTAYAPGVSCAIVGTASKAHLDRAIATVGQGPLPASLSRAVRERFQTVGAQWRGEI